MTENVCQPSYLVRTWAESFSTVSSRCERPPEALKCHLGLYIPRKCHILRVSSADLKVDYFEVLGRHRTDSKTKSLKMVTPVGHSVGYEHEANWELK